MKLGTPLFLKKLSKTWQFWFAVVSLVLVVGPVVVGSFFVSHVNPYSQAGYYEAAPLAVPCWASVFYGNIPPDIKVPSSFSLIAAKTPSVLQYWHFRNFTANNDTVTVIYDPYFGPSGESFTKIGYAYGNTGNGSIEIVIRGDNPVNVTFYHAFDYSYLPPFPEDFFVVQSSIYVVQHDSTMFYDAFITNPENKTYWILAKTENNPESLSYIIESPTLYEFYILDSSALIISNGTWNYVLSTSNAPTTMPFYYELPSNESGIASLVILNRTFVKDGIYNVSFTIQYIPYGTNSSMVVYLSDVYFEFLGSRYGLMGTDDHGSSVFVEYVQGGVFDLELALAVGLAIVAVGAVVGILAAYYGGLWDKLLVATTDFFLLIPGLVFLIVITMALDAAFPSIAAHYKPLLLGGVIVLLSWSPTARVIRGQAYVIKSQPFIEAARALGLSNLQILRKHVLPHLYPIVVAQIIFDVPAVIAIESVIDFIGIGITGFPTWGNMLGFASGYLSNSGGTAPYYAWWWVFPPAIAITLLGISLFFLGEAILKIQRVNVSVG